MILISVKSEVQDTKRQFEDSKSAEKYIKQVKDLHDLHRIQYMGKRPNGRRNKNRAKEWDEAFKACIPLRVKIINTDQNQLSLTPILIESRVSK